MPGILSNSEAVLFFSLRLRWKSRAKRWASSLIFKFDKKGNFVKTFGKEGQGPGEFQRPANLGVNSKGEISVTDIRNYKIYFFREMGLLSKRSR
jgi:hypothetical protein